MKKVIDIEGMSCDHCQARVEKALNAMTGVKAKVNLKQNHAVVDLSKEIDDETLKQVIEDAGYEVIRIKEKKGLFGR